MYFCLLFFYFNQFQFFFFYISSCSTSHIFSHSSLYSPTLAPLPPPQPPLPLKPFSHPMTTRSKYNIFKPKCLYQINTTHPLLESIEPICVSQAIKYVEWREAMSDELQHFFEMVHGISCHLAPLKMLLVVNGCSTLNDILMALFLSIKLALLLKVFISSLALIFMTSLVR